MKGKYIFEKMSASEIAEMKRYEPKIRFLIGSGEYVISCFSLSDFRYDEKLPQPKNIKVSAHDLISMIEFEEGKRIWLSNNADDYEVDKKLKKSEAEVDKYELLNLLNLDNDSFEDISLVQYLYCLSSSILGVARIQWHKYKLGRVKSVYVDLVARNFESYHNRGRKKGKSELNAVERERIEQNLKEESVIVQKFIERDNFDYFIDFYREKARYNKVAFSRVGTSWAFKILRYKWKVANGFKSRDLDYEKELNDKIKKYKLSDNFGL